MRRWVWVVVVAWVICLAGCGETAVSPPILPLAPTATAVAPTATATRFTLVLAPSPSPSPNPSPSPSPSLTPFATPLPSPTPDPYAPFTIAALAIRPYGGGRLQIEDTLEQNEAFTRYLITYPSDGLTIYGYMNVPREGDRFPVVLMLHGYIAPEEYETVAYTGRYADDLAEAGYFVIHPNFRNYPPSDSGDGSNPFRIDYAIDVLNLIAILREQSQDPLGVLRRADADAIHLWGHSMGGGVALRVITVNPSPYLKTAVLYGSMSGDEQVNYGQIRQWTNGRAGEFELAAPPETLTAISSIAHLERIQAAISIHHSAADETVPVEWSEELCARLTAVNHPVECFIYEAQPHTFRGLGDAQFMERVRLFYERHSTP